MLIDTIAAAIWAEHTKAVQSQATDWNEADAATRELFTRYASAALDALAEPTPEMLSRGNRALQAWDDSEHYRSPINGIYHAMITPELPHHAAVVRDDYDEL